MKIQLIDFGGKRPDRAHYNDAGADVFAHIPNDWDEYRNSGEPAIVIRSGETKKIPLGIGVRLPDGFMMNVYPRSGLSSKGIDCKLPPIDSGYEGEIHAIVYNGSNDYFTIRNGDKIGQLVMVPIVLCDFTWETPGEKRGANGFGSTDKKE